MLRRILFNADPPAEVQPPAPGTSQPATPAAPVAVPSAGAAPPAGSVIAGAQVNEETERLRQERDALAQQVREREAQVATVEKNFQDYRAAVETRPAPAPKKAHWLSEFVGETD